MKKSEDITYLHEEKSKHIYLMPKFRRAGYVKAISFYDFEPHKHIDYEWIYVKKGSLDFSINNKQFVVKEGDFYFLQPNQNHEEISSSNDLIFYYVSFFYFDLSRNIHYIIPEGEDVSKQIIRGVSKDFIEVYEKIINEVKEKPIGFKESVEALLLYLIWQVRRMLGLNTKPDLSSFDKKISYVNKAIEYMKNHIEEGIRIKDISDKLNISTDYFAHIFKSITGVSPYKYLMRAKIERSKSLLTSNDLSVSQISEKLAFYDQSTFSKQFKNIVGITPIKYRQREKSK